jgi:hypothetical protein
MAFKEDEDFQRFLTMGAYAAAAIQADLETRGHRIIELERYAKANKIWATKVKRLRLPDLLCIQCGRRFESKGKTTLELKLSDSSRPGREWWAGGMRLSDVFSFVEVAVTPEGDTKVGKPVYVTRQSLADAQEALVAGQRKAVSAGSEIAVSWPSWVPKTAGRVDSIVDLAVSITTVEGRKQTYRNARNWPAAFILRGAGSSFAAHEMILSSVEPADVQCPGPTWDWLSDLDADGDDDRFAATKAARWLNDGTADSILAGLAAHEDWRVALEASASLVPREPIRIEQIARVAMAATADAVLAVIAQAMEAVFVLSEHGLPAAQQSLIAIAGSHSLHPEVRAAAVWGLGLGASPDARAVLPFLGDPVDLVALHASAALPAVLPDGIVAELDQWLVAKNLRESASAVHALAERGYASNLVAALPSAPTDQRAIILRALGDMPRAMVAPLMDKMSPRDLSTLETLWVREVDWLRSQTTDGVLGALARQRVRL